MSKFTQQGGAWLGAVRSWMQRKCRNGEYVTWGRGDLLERDFRVRDVEEIGALAVDAAQPEVDKLQERIEKLRLKLFNAQVDIECLSQQLKQKEKG